MSYILGRRELRKGGSLLVVMGVLKALRHEGRHALSSGKV
jgi:hypothetical protein